MAADQPPNETERLRALRRLDVLDSAPEPSFDRLVHLAAAIFEAPIGLLTLVDEGRQWFKAAVGIGASETCRDDSFCAHAILADDALVVTDAREDPRFAENPLVTGPPGIRFYAGAPLTSSDGFNLGTLCVIDTAPRAQPSADRLRVLSELAAVAVDELELRFRARSDTRAVELQSLLSAIVDSSDDAILSKDLNGTILTWNAGATRLYGYSADEVVGKSIEILVPDDRPDEVPSILARIRAGQGINHHETERVHRDGTRIPVSVTISPIRDAAGELFGASTIARDIRERKRADAALAAAHTAELEASRLKSEFVATISHEIRTPMNGVIGMTGLLLETELDAQQREWAETVRRSGEALLTIINDILDFSKIEAGRMDLEVIDFDLRTVVEDVADLLAERAHAKGLELVTLVAPDVPDSVRGDPGRVRQIVVNLVVNSIKFTDEGEVVVRVDVGEESNDGVLVRFEVIDTGIGIRPERRADLFEAFSQADSSTTRTHGGTGLGLAISKHFVELMDGEIGVDSEVGKGSTFWFTVRLLKGSELPPIRHAASDDLRGSRVLIVDDNETNRELLRHQIGSWGMHPATTEDAEGALRLLHTAASAGDNYDLAILDMNMPGTDGLQLARMIAADAALPNIPLVLLTSSGVRGSGQDAAEAGIAAYLTKPIRQSRLHDCIATLLAPAAPPPPMITQHTIAEARARARPRILVAEDNQVNQQVAVGMLGKLGYRADVVANGAEAVEALSRISYGAVLMDCQMPEMDGYEATGEIRRIEGAARHTPIIALTAGAMVGEREKCLAAGMDDYIAKPVQLAELGAQLRRWIADDDDSEASEADAPPLDHDRLAELRGLATDDDPDAVTALFAAFLEDADSQLAALRAAIESADPREVRRIAHGLKGSSANFGATRMAELCADLEATGGSGDSRRDASSISMLERELDRVRIEVERERATAPPA